MVDCSRHELRLGYSILATRSTSHFSMEGESLESDKRVDRPDP